MTTPTRSEIEALRDRLRVMATALSQIAAEFPWDQHDDRHHVPSHSTIVMRDTADLLDALLKEPDLTYVQRERDQAVMRWQIAEERVKRLQGALLPFLSGTAYLTDAHFDLARAAFSESVDVR